MKKKLTAEEEKQRNIRWIRALFLVYLLIVIKLIIFKYPMDNYGLLQQRGVRM